jgi:hypothetical protein
LHKYGGVVAPLIWEIEAPGLTGADATMCYNWGRRSTFLIHHPTPVSYLILYEKLSSPHCD